MASKIWFSICLLLFAYNLISLINECYSVNYKIVEEGDNLFDNDTNYLFCTPFSYIADEGLSDYQRTIHEVSVKSFLSYSILSIENYLKVKNLFSLNESYIFNKHVCFKRTKNSLEEVGKPFNEFLRTYQLQNIFIYSNGKQPFFYESPLEKLGELSSVYFKAYKQKVFNRNHLLNPDCLNQENQIYYDRGACLNKCLVKLKIKTSFYNFNDSELFDLNLIASGRKEDNQNMNYEDQVFRKILKGCLKKCKETDCFWEVVTAVKIDEYYYNEFLKKEGKDKVDLSSNIYSAYYSTEDYYLQLFGLLTLFTGTSVVRLFPAMLSLSVKTFRKHNSKYYKFFRIFRLTYPKIKFAITFLSFIFVLNQCLSMVTEFEFKLNYPNKTSSSMFISDPFSLVVCFPTDPANVKQMNSEFKLIEEDTRWFLDDNSLQAYIKSGTNLINASFSISNEVLFKNSTFESQVRLSRCFRIDFELRDIRYKTMMPLAHLLFYPSLHDKELFLIDKSQNFTSGLVNFQGMFNHQRVTKFFSEKSKKSNCKDYSKEHYCSSRRNCIDRCITTEFIKKHASIPTNTVVNATSLPSFLLNSGIKFNETADISIEEQCTNQFNQSDCIEVYFEEAPELVSSEIMGHFILKLTYSSKTEKELAYLQWKTVLDIISQASIFFGVNVTGALASLFFVISQTFRLKLHKAYDKIIFLVAGMGFLIHNFLVFQSIIKGELNENQFFEKPERYIMPSPVFCFRLSNILEDIDENHRLTGGYLDDLTKGLTFKHVFNKIVYFNKTSRAELEISEKNSTKSSNFYADSNIILSHFYYSELKCFKVNINVSYEEEDFYFLDEKYILKIYLEREFTEKNRETTFFYQQAGSKEISGGFTYQLGTSENYEDYDYENLESYYSYVIKFELFKMTREDKFELLKDPRNLFYEKIKVNDVAEYLNAMEKKFYDDYNLTTSDFLLDDYFDVEVDNELFEQFYRQIQNISDQTKFKSRNFEQNIPNIATDIFYTNYGDSDFFFTLSTLARRVEITNNDNYTKIVVGFLNSLSLWMNICILDIGPYLYRILRLSLHLYQRLTWVRGYFRRAINSLESG